MPNGRFNNTGAVATITAVMSEMTFTGPDAAASHSGSGTWLQTPGSVMHQTWYKIQPMGSGLPPSATRPAT
jgi:hypothetical protein